MTRYMFDSGIVGDYVYRRHGVYQRARREAHAGRRLGTGAPVLGEFLAGVLASDTRERNLPIVRRNRAQLTVWPFGEEAASIYGELWAALRAVGRPMQVPDIQIAAIALSLGDCIVVSKDGDLNSVPGLTVEDWSQP